MTTTSSIEQLLRAEMMSKKVGNNDIDRLVRYMKQYEDEHVWAPEVVTDESDASLETHDPWIRNQLKEIKQTEAQLRQERREWYDRVRADVISTRNQMGTVGSKTTIADHFDTRILHDEEHARDAADTLRAGKYIGEDYYTHIDNCDGVDIRDCGFDLPIPLIVYQTLSGDTFPFVPWCGVATCTCHAKHDAANSGVGLGLSVSENYETGKIFCQHELRALDGLKGRWPPDDITLPTEYTRLFTPHAYNRLKHISNGDQ